MSADYDEFKTIMDENVDGHPVDIRYGESMTEGLPAVRILKYDDYPRPGFKTAVTYGLSLADHPESPHWTDSKPELSICVRSAHDMWGGLIGLMADVFRGDRPVEPGKRLTFNFPMNEHTHMDGIMVGGPAPFPMNPIALTTRKILIRSAYPIYRSEGTVIDSDGWERFLERIGQDALFDPWRPSLVTDTPPSSD